MINKTFRLFISSTFSDFLTERALLNGEIFARAEEFCRSRGYHFQLIDLRWGINTESALNQQTISICLDEVRRCRTLAPRPNFLILSGERYGWIPLPPQLERTRFEALLSAADEAESTLLRRWYEPDENALGGVWYLKSRQGDFADDAHWQAEEDSLRHALMAAGRRCGWTEQELAVLNTSATEQEIMAGFLADGDGSDNVIAVLRRGHPQQDADPTRALALQDRIAQAMEADGNGRCILRLDWDSDYEQRFCRTVTQLLLANIEEEMARLEAMEHQTQTSDVVTAEGIFRGRDEELSALERYVNDSHHAPLFLCGDSGSGKSTLLRHFAARQTLPVFFASFGTDVRSYTITQVLDRLQSWCQRLCDTILDVSHGPAEQVDLIMNALGCHSKQRFVIIIDGLDMFYDLASVHESFLPNHLPDNVSLIVSAADRDKVAVLIPDRAEHVAVTAFDESESLQLFDRLLEAKGRAIVPQAQRRLISAAFSGGVTPLQVKLTAAMANRWHSGQTVPALPATAEETALAHVESMFRSFGHEQNLTLCAMALIAVAPTGITEEELQLLLPRFPEVRKRLDAEDRYTGGLDKLPFVVWSRLFYDLGDCLVLEQMDGAIVVKFAHQVFYRAFSAAYGEHCRRAAQLLRQFYLEQPNYAAADTRLPNRRKVLSLLPLLEREEQWPQAAALLEELSFTDAYLHAAGTAETIQVLRHALAWEVSPACRDRLQQLLACLLEHRGTLTCYPHTFLRRCAQLGLCQTPDVPGIIPPQPDRTGRRVFFPYSSNAEVYWQEEYNRFAVCHGCYVFLCDGESGSEFARIYLPRQESDDLDATVCRKFCWLGKDAVLCCYGKDLAEVYDISGDVPRPHYPLDWNGKSHTVAYSRPTGVLLLVQANLLCAIRVADGTRLWSVDIGSGKDFFFALHANEKRLCFKPTGKGFCLYDVATGALIRHVPHQLMQKVVVESNCGRWFSYQPDDTVFAENMFVYDEAKRKNFHLVLPMMDGIQDILCADNSVFFRYHSGLIRMDLTDFSLAASPIHDIRHINWICRGSSLSVLTGHGLYRVEPEDFTPLGFTALTSSNRKTGRFLMLTHVTKQLGASVRDFGRILGALSNFWRYPARFLLVDNNSHLLENATLVSFAPDGKTAVAYEGSDEMSVFDRQGVKILHCDRMGLGVNDGILRMIFSDDSRYLLLWRNRQLQVLDTLMGKAALKVDLAFAPALSAAFDGEAVVLTLCDGSTHAIPFEKHKARFHCGVNRKDKQYYGPYTARCTDGQVHLVPYVDPERLALTGSCKNWLNTDRIYGDLAFTGGVFSLNGQALAAPGMDFLAALELERQGDDQELDTYLREKNDLSYGLFALGTNLLLLVSPLLSSVLLIDCEQNQVVDAYRHHAPIIGHRMLADNRLELVSVQGKSSSILELCL